MREETLQVPFDDAWANVLRSGKEGKRASLGMMIDLGLDTTLQWKIQSVGRLEGDFVKVTFVSAPVDLDSAESLKIDTEVEMRKRNLMWHSLLPSKMLSGGVEYTYGYLTSIRDPGRLEFIDGTSLLDFWKTAHNRVCDWDMGEPLIADA